MWIQSIEMNTLLIALTIIKTKFSNKERERGGSGVEENFKGEFDFSRTFLKKNNFSFGKF